MDFRIVPRFILLSHHSLNLRGPSGVKPFLLIGPGIALDYVLRNSFTEAAGARNGFPKVLVIITDGKSEDPVQSYAKQLRSTGVEIFVLGT